MNEIPGEWAAILDTTAPGIVEQTNRVAVPGEDWISSIGRALQTVAMADYQRQLLQVQLERARRGQAPLNPTDYGLGVNLGISSNVMLLGLAAIAVLYLVMRRR